MNWPNNYYHAFLNLSARIVNNNAGFIRKKNHGAFLFVYLPVRTTEEMQDIIADGTYNTPEVIFRANGDLSLSGRSMILDVAHFYGPLCEWLKNLDSPNTNIHVRFDYLNSASSKKILEMLKILDDNNNVINFDVFWHFETNDEDILEIGQIFEERMRKARFYFKEYAEA